MLEILDTGGRNKTYKKELHGFKDLKSMHFSKRVFSFACEAQNLLHKSLFIISDQIKTLCLNYQQQVMRH